MPTGDRGKSQEYHLPIMERFWKRVERTEGCWVWIDVRNTHGYGIFRIASGQKVRAHRFSYEAHKGPIPKGLLVCHSCDNPACVRPDHLFVGTMKDNMRDCSEKGRLGAQRYPELLKRMTAISLTCPELRPRAEEHPLAKLSNADVVFIKQRAADGMVRGEKSSLARRFGVTPGAIGHIVNGRQWKSVL